MPARNEELFIERCLKSIFSQTYTDYEVVVIDDGSKDRTYELAAKYDVILIRHRQSKGVAVSFNRGIEKARGDIICTLGADDFVSSDYLEKNLKAFLEPDVMGVFPIMEFVEPDTFTGRVFYFYRQIFLIKDKHSQWPMIWNRRIFDYVRFDESLTVGEDADLWKRIKLKANSNNWVFRHGTGVYYAAGQPDSLVSNLRSSFWYGLGYVRNCRKNRRSVTIVFSMIFFAGFPFASTALLLTWNVICLSWVLLYVASFPITLLKAIRKHTMATQVAFIPFLLTLRALGHLAGMISSFFLPKKESR